MDKPKMSELSHGHVKQDGSVSECYALGAVAAHHAAWEAYAAQLEAERDALRVDAERYRWLRRQNVRFNLSPFFCLDGLDAAVDPNIAAREGERREG